MKRQTIISGGRCIGRLAEALDGLGARRPLLVAGRSLARLPAGEAVRALGGRLVPFGGFTPNPRIEEVRAGTELFRSEGCDSVLAVGGGSAMDVGKCIKLFATLDPAGDFLEQEFRENGIPLAAVPTTAGTGSESTRFAVVYDRGEKRSVTHDSILPDVAILDASSLPFLPPYQKKSTLLDALCQGIESWWSVRSTEESRALSRQALETIAADGRAYLSGGGPGAAERILLAANLAGRAINIARTTAPHAMSYKLTMLYGLAHGHAAAACLPRVWAHMLRAAPAACTDPRGRAHLDGVFQQIARTLGAPDAAAAVAKLDRLLDGLGMGRPAARGEGDFALLAASVNRDRLKNNPVALTGPDLLSLYRQIVRPAGGEE